MRPPSIGLAGEYRIEPAPDDTAAAVGNDGVAVVSTPALILYLEQASRRLIAPFLEPGEAPVGVVVDVKHVGAAVSGRPVVARSEVTTVAAPRIDFAVEARQGDKLLMRGSYAQVIVGLAAFLERQGLRPSRRRRLDFWFDVASPWSYLASLRVADVARRHHLDLHWQPLDARRLAEATGGPRLPDLRSEPTGPIAVWQRQDLVERAAALGVAIKNPAMRPSDSTPALRAVVHSVAAGKAEAFVTRVMQRCWSEGADIAEPALLAAWGAETGLGGIIEATGDPSRIAELDAHLDANLAAAAAAGVFDLPAAVIHGRIYFGVERLDLLERHLLATATSPGS